MVTHKFVFNSSYSQSFSKRRHNYFLNQKEKDNINKKKLEDNDFERKKK